MIIEEYFKTPFWFEEKLDFLKSLTKETDNYIKEARELRKAEIKKTNDFGTSYHSKSLLNDTWIYKEIHPYIHEANKLAGWNYDWNFSESCQFTKYKLNQYYDWHCDSWDKPYDKPEDPNSYGKIRKLSVTCQLTDGSEYEGGELQFDCRNYDPHMRDEDKHVLNVKEILPKGSIVVFPSFVWHRVQPVTKGTRYSLVIWNLGYPFK